jgi:hypothetical protein
MKKCVYCNENIRDTASFCDHCGQEQPIEVNNSKSPSQSIFQYLVEKFKTNGIISKTWFTCLMLYLFFPIGLYLMWKYKKFNYTVRVVISVIFAVLSCWAIYYNLQFSAQGI